MSGFLCFVIDCRCGFDEETKHAKHAGPCNFVTGDLGLFICTPLFQTLVTPREVGPNSQISKVANNSPVTPGRKTHSNLAAI